MKILLHGYYGFGNFGDDLLLICTHALARKFFPDASITVFSNFTPNLSGYSQRPDYCQYIKRFIGEDVRLVDWTHKEHFDLVIHGGGGTFFDAAEAGISNSAVNVGIRFLGAPRYSRLIGSLRRILGRPSHLSASRRIGIGIGVGPYPIQGERFKREAAILGEFDRLAVRDTESLAWAKRLGIQNRTRAFTDLVFESNNWLPDYPAATEAKDSIGIAICQGKTGNDELIDAAEHLSANGLPEPLYMFLDENHDRNLIERFESSGKQVLVWRPWSMDIADFVKRLATCKLLVTNRAHGAIVGACVGVPSLCIATDAKLRAVQRMIPNGSKLVTPPLTQYKLIGAIADTLRALGRYQSGLEKDVALRRAEVERMIEYAFG